MACYSPITAWQTVSGDVVFAQRGNIARELTLPCGGCVGCRLERSRHWAMRCVHESKLYEASSFVTLTYSPENNPVSLDYGHFQKFMYRVRKKFPCIYQDEEGKWHGPRFYMCGEYGEKLSRPHYHAILFGLWFDDLQLFSEREGVRLYTSKCLDQLWSKGFATVGLATGESAAYCARYIMKKINGQMAEDHYRVFVPETGEVMQLTPEFNRMSLKPGIGAKWFERWQNDVFNNSRDSVMFNGMECAPPRYYKEYLERVNPDMSEHIDLMRYKRSFNGVEDRTPERLRVREICAQARVNLLSRNLEK